MKPEPLMPAHEGGDLIREWVGRVLAGEARVHDLPESLNQQDKAEIRRLVVASRTESDLDHLGRYSLDAERAGSQHCENLIGAMQIPLGVVGPLKVVSEHVALQEELWVPLATTEGALVASVNRGCRAITEAGGAEVFVEDVGITRAPVFRVKNRKQANQFIDWVTENHQRLKEVTEATSGHLTLREVRPHVVGTSVFLRFRFLTDDAMGMNMATIACDRVIRELIGPETGIECVALSGNYCVDKKPSMLNFLEGRGKRIHAEAIISDQDLAHCLKTDADAMLEVQWRKNFVGSIASGTFAYNAHFANVVAAFFLATGQDPAQVVEAAMGVTTIDRAEGGIHIAVNLPDVPLGAIGGGTALATQQECLQILGVTLDSERPGTAAMRLAEILGAVVLCGELSLLAALTSSDLAGAHERLARRSSIVD